MKGTLYVPHSNLNNIYPLNKPANAYWKVLSVCIYW